ncbi:MAG: hypothetical protein EAZ24_13005 [Burkholderiales bacterium]|nr:MAG: hypothetical protein EAZ24_13005 [Burkholderiales bacterium]TAG83049.1 MAG: hypothetical protein EAZ21_02435 [Betaproteobacteria bacterium]
MKRTVIAAICASACLAAVQAQPQIAPQKLQVPQKINPDALKPLVLPDLVVSSITLRPIGSTGYAYVCVRNQNPSATGAFDVQVTMQAAAPTGSPPISWAVLVGKIRYPAFTAGTSFVCNDFMLPDGKMPNCVKVVASADVGREVAESNETNNSRDVLSTCLGDPPKPPASLPRLIDLPKLPPKP